MQFTSAIAVLAVAATASAYSNDTIVYTTIVVDSYTTVCPASGTLTYQGQTWTNTLTEVSSVTVTNCPCTVTAPVSVISSVAVPTTAPAVPTTTPAAPVYTNATTPAVVASSTKPVVVSSATASASSTPSAVVGSGANKAFAMSGASLAGVLGLAAYFL